MLRVRFVWLRQRSELGKRSLQVQNKIRFQGVHLEVVDALGVSSDQLARADLILLEAFDRFDGMIETVLADIRLESRVPLVILTNDYSTDQLITALAAGADAIWDINAPQEILLARCKALLRRWIGPPR